MSSKNPSNAGPALASFSSLGSSLSDHDFVSSLFNSDDTFPESPLSSSIKCTELIGSPQSFLLEMETKFEPHPSFSSMSPGKFVPREKEAQGVAQPYGNIKMSAQIAKFLHGPLPTSHCSALSSPAILGDLVMVGTEDKSAENFLVCIDHNVARRSSRQSPIVAVGGAKDGLLHPVWLGNSHVVCGTEKGLIYLFSFNKEKKSIMNTGVLSGIHSDEIREISVCPIKKDHIASAGADHHLCITDMETSQLVQKVDLKAVAGSVKWSGYSGSDLGVTLDSGKLLLFDQRRGLQSPSLSFDLELKHKRLYTHTRYGEFGYFLGFCNGDVGHIEVRNSAYHMLSEATDYFCEGIGRIDCSRHNAIVTSGYADFTVWKQNHRTGEMNIWSHSKTSLEEVDPNLSYCASFITDDVIVATTSNGYLGFWEQGFDLADDHQLF